MLLRSIGNITVCSFRYTRYEVATNAPRTWVLALIVLSARSSLGLRKDWNIGICRKRQRIDTWLDPAIEIG